MALNQTEGFAKFLKIIDLNLRPPNYKKYLETAKKCTLYLADTAEGQRESLKTIRKAETSDQEDQRVRLSNAMTSVALHPVFSYVEEIKRTDGIVAVVRAKDTQKERVQPMLDKYYHNLNLFEYIFEAATHYAVKSDPNAWTVFEASFAGNTDGSTSLTDYYPTEVKSKEVRSFAHDETGRLEYLCFEFQYAVRDGDQMQQVSDFYFYGIGYSFRAVEFNSDFTYGIDFKLEGFELQAIGDRSFYVRAYTNTLKEVPAVRWAAWFDESFKILEVGEPIFAGAFPVLEELLKDNSILQLIKYLHAHPERHSYVKPCRHRDESGRECIDGYYGGEKLPDSQCTRCKGSGIMIPQSEQDAIMLKFPQRPEDIFELSKLTYYVERPIEIFEKFREEVDTGILKVMYATFNQININVGEVVQVGETATKTRLDYDKIYNKLFNFAQLVANAWMLAQRVSYQYLGIDATALMTFPHDFKLKSVPELTSEYSAAKSAGLPYYVLDAIERDIVNKQYRDNSTEANEVLALNRWKPWKDKTVEQAAMIAQQLDPSDTFRVLFEFWSVISERVRLQFTEGEYFHALDGEEQFRVLQAEAAKLAGELQRKSLPAVPPVTIDEEE